MIGDRCVMIMSIFGADTRVGIPLDSDIFLNQNDHLIAVAELWYTLTMNGPFPINTCLSRVTCLPVHSVIEA